MRARIPIPTDLATDPADAGAIVITWRDRVDRHAPRALRLRCPCAHCVDEMSGAPLLDPATVPAGIQAVHLDRIGTYALRITWSDGHSAGLFTYANLRALGEA